MTLPTALTLDVFDTRSAEGGFSPIITSCEGQDDDPSGVARGPASLARIRLLHHAHPAIVWTSCLCPWTRTTFDRKYPNGKHALAAYLYHQDHLRLMMNVDVYRCARFCPKEEGLCPGPACCLLAAEGDPTAANNSATAPRSPPTLPRDDAPPPLPVPRFLAAAAATTTGTCGFCNDVFPVPPPPIAIKRALLLVLLVVVLVSAPSSAGPLAFAFGSARPCRPCPPLPVLSGTCC